MIDASMLLHMISALDTLEKLLPASSAGEYAVKKREWESLKKACWTEYRAKERSRDRGMGMGRLHVTEGECLLGAFALFFPLRLSLRLAGLFGPFACAGLRPGASVPGWDAFHVMILSCTLRIETCSPSTLPHRTKTCLSATQSCFPHQRRLGLRVSPRVAAVSSRTRNPYTWAACTKRRSKEQNMKE